MQTHYDVVVIGAGSGGLTSAVGFSKVGKKVLLIEKAEMGGECTNSGCIPSKALLHHAKSYHAATTIAGDNPKASAYRKAAFSYVREKIDAILEHETPDIFREMGIDVVLGEAVFTDAKTITVGQNEYSFTTAVIASGSLPRPLEVTGLEEKYVLTNQNVFALTAVPKRLLVIGSGPIGMELGQAFALLGSAVTIATIDTSLGRLEDPVIAERLTARFTELDIAVKTKANITSVSDTTAHFDQEGTQLDIPFDKVLIAIGRVPQMPAGLSEAGIDTTPHGITVDSQYRTTNKRVYAVGDVAARFKFTHVADDVGRQVVTRVVSKGLLRVKNHKAVPKVTYTSPEIAQVGQSYEAAKQKYGEAELIRLEVPYSQNDRAHTDDATDGVLIVVAKRLSGKILGANIYGPAAGELLSIFTLAIDNKISLWKLQKLIYPYPTYSLLIKKAGDQFFGSQMSTLKTDMMNALKRQAPKLIGAAIWIALLVVLFNYKSTNDLTVTDISLQLFDIIALSAIGPLLYILIYTVRPITFLPATALTILAGVFFDLFWGTVYTVIAGTLSAMVAFGVGRFFSSNIRLEEGVLGNFVTAVRENTFTSVLTARLIFLPFDVVSYAAGILQTKFIPFSLGTLLGIPLGTATFVSIGASLNIEEFKMNGFTTDVIEPEFLLFSALIFVVSLALSKVLKRFSTKH